MDRPIPSHIAWRCGGLRDLLRALKAIPEAETGTSRDRARKAVLDAHARDRGCVRGGDPRRWYTAEEWAAYRRENPGYRLDSARHRTAALSLPAKFRRERAAAGGRAPREE
jgi:hypothetical protein